MAIETEKLKLVKPAGGDYVDVGVLNENFNKIDDALTDDIAGNSTSSTKYPSTKAVWDTFLPLTGGTVRGNIELQTGDNKVGMYEANGNLDLIATSGDGQSSRDLAVWNPDNRSDLADSLKLYDKVNGVTTGYKVFGEHNKDSLPGIRTEDGVHVRDCAFIYADNKNSNLLFAVGGTNGFPVAYYSLTNSGKLIHANTAQVFFNEKTMPAGSYAGNNATRTINIADAIGGRKLLCIRANDGFGFVSGTGAVKFNLIGTQSVEYYSDSDMVFDGATLQIKKTTASTGKTYFNRAGVTYYWQVL